MEMLYMVVRGHSSVVEYLTADQEVSSSNLDAPLTYTYRNNQIIWNDQKHFAVLLWNYAKRMHE